MMVTQFESLLKTSILLKEDILKDLFIKKYCKYPFFSPTYYIRLNIITNPYYIQLNIITNSYYCNN